MGYARPQQIRVHMVDEPEQSIRVVGPHTAPPEDVLDRTRMSAAQRWDSLLWESVDGTPILANLYRTRDPAELRRREYHETARRSLEIACGLVDIAHTGDRTELQEIHAHLFAKVYPWAGRLRDVDMSRHGQNFLMPEHVAEFVDGITSSARSIDWAQLDESEFVDNVAKTSMALNWAHPFREGNGRSTRLFLDRLISQARFELDYNLVDPTAWRLAHYDAHPEPDLLPVDYSPLASVIAAMTVPRADIGIEMNHLGSGDIAVTVGSSRENTAGQQIGEAIDAAGLTSPTPAHQLDHTPAATETAARTEHVPEIGD